MKRSYLFGLTFVLAVLGGSSVFAQLSNPWENKCHECNWFGREINNPWDDKDHEYNWFHKHNNTRTGSDIPRRSVNNNQGQQSRIGSSRPDMFPSAPGHERGFTSSPSNFRHPNAGPQFDQDTYVSAERWSRGIKNVFWEEYRGNNIRVEVLRNNSDIREMRLKFVQSNNMVSDPDGTIIDMLNNVADQVMRNTCGKRARQAIVLYERPGIEFVQQTAADMPDISSAGDSLREYGFRCIY